MSAVASRYAKSLLDLAIDQSNLAEIVSDVSGLQSAFKSKDLALLIKSPIIKTHKKAEIFNSLFAGKLNPLTLAFLLQTIKKRREIVLPEMLNEFTRLYNQMQKVTSVKVTLANDADPNLMNKIKEKLQQSGVTSDNVNIKKVIDPSILGGYIIEFGDKLLDASVAHQLNKLKQSFTN